MASANAYIESFFQSIDRRIVSINEKIQLASKRLRNLLDTLKHKQLFKIKIEKLLLLLLRSSRNEKGDIKINEVFKNKYLPFIGMRFISVPKMDFKFYTKTEPHKQEIDSEYQEKERNKGLELLEIQEATAKWLDEINSELELGNEIKFEQWFDKIVTQEKNLEVPIQVCFGLIEEYDNSQEIHVVIKKEEVVKINYDLKLWKMQIQTSRS